MNTLPDFTLTQPHGPFSGTTMVLLHGAFGAKEYWRGQIGALVAQGHRVLAWDAPGYGVSPLPADFSIDTCADALARLLAAHGGERNVIMGHSMGGMIAQRAWSRCPERIQGYVLSATGASFGRPDGAWQQEFVRLRLGPLDAGQTIAEYAPKMLRSMMSPGASGEDVELTVRTVAAMREETFRAAMHAIVTFEGRATLPTITVPTLCIAGEVDATAPAEAMRKMATKIPAAQYAQVDGAGHFAWAEQPSIFQGRVSGFLQEAGFSRA